jgi:hypothetical protein
MAFTLTGIDQIAIASVDIEFDIDLAIYKDFADRYINDQNQLRLNADTIMFPPEITKDSKSANYISVETTGSYEGFKFYKESTPRQLGLKFEWVCGGNFTPLKIHTIVSKIKGYFYNSFFGKDNPGKYPALKIHQLYHVIPPNLLNPSTWRMMDVNIKYSKEMTVFEVGTKNIIYPVHTIVDMNLESVTQLKNPKLGNEASTIASKYTNLSSKPTVSWF